jgi:hypothetical protein
MPKKELNDFQLDLLQKKRDKARVKQEQDLRKRIFALGEESNKERKLRIAVANANKVIAAEIARKRGIVSEDESDDDELDSNSSNEVETVSSHDSDTNTDPHTSPTNERDKLQSLIRERDFSHAVFLVFGLVIGLLIGLLQQPFFTKMVKQADRDSSEDDEYMNGEQGASAATAAPASFAELMGREAKDKRVAITDSQILNPEGQGREAVKKTQRNWTFEGEHEDGDQDEDFLLPPSQKFRPS